MKLGKAANSDYACWSCSSTAALMEISQRQVKDKACLMTVCKLSGELRIIRLPHWESGPQSLM